MRKIKNKGVKEPNSVDKDDEEMDDLEFDEMNDVWDELDDLDV